MIKCDWCKKLFKKDKLHEMSYLNQHAEKKIVLFCKHCKEEIGEYLIEDKKF
jgi:hypothetical protein